MTDIQWYAAMTGPRMEFTADENLRRQGYWTWLPHERVKKRRKIPNRPSYKIEYVNEAYFPGYLFVALRKPTDSIYAVNETDGVSTVVYQAGEPLCIPQDVMTELMGRADVNGFIGQVDRTARKRFKPGQKVKFVDESPLAGLLALVSLDKGPAVRVFIEMLGRNREISVHPELLAAAS